MENKVSLHRLRNILLEMHQDVLGMKENVKDEQFSEYVSTLLFQLKGAREMSTQLLRSIQKDNTMDRDARLKSVITLEVGHGPHPAGFEPGAVDGRTKTEEWKVNHVCALACKQYLDTVGYEDVLVTDENNYLSKVGWNNHKSDVFVSVHHNAFSSDKAQGAEALVHDTLANDNDLKLAKLCSAAFARELKIPDRGVKTRGLSVLAGAINNRWKDTQAVCLVEPYFITGKTVDDHASWSNRAGVAMGMAINEFLRGP